MVEQCYTHTHIYNNWLETGWVYENGPAGLYSDAAGCGTVFENNILRGQGSGALLHHCGLDNESKNNIVHRNGANSFDHIWAGCEKHSTLVDRVGASLGLYSSYRGGRGGHPLTVPQYTKDHLKSIISLPPDWPGNDTTQMMMRVFSSPVWAYEI